MVSEYDLRVHTEGAYNDGVKKGLIEGAREKALSSAREMLADGLAPEKIAKYTGQALAEVEALVPNPSSIPFEML